MTFEQFKKIIDEVACFDPAIVFTGGEPLLHKDIFRMIDYTRSKGLYMQIDTNGVLLSRNDNARKLAKSPPDMALIAYEALDKKTYEDIRKNSTYESMLEGIKELITLKNESDEKLPRVTVQMVLTKKNQKYENEFWKAAEDIGADFASIKALGIWPEGTAEYERQMIDEYLIPMDEHRISRHRLDENGKLVSERKIGECPSIRLSYIGSGGEMLPCTWILAQNNSMGNAIDDGFIKTWKSPEYRQLRNKMLNDKASDLCDKCIGVGAKAEVRKIGE